MYGLQDAAGMWLSGRLLAYNKWGADFYPTDHLKTNKKKCSTPLAVREKHIKTAVSYCIPIRMGSTNNSDNIECGEDEEKLIICASL